MHACMPPSRRPSPCEGAQCLQGQEAAAQAIMNDVEAAVERMRTEVDKDKVTAAMRSEALEPTRDAIKARASCILTRRVLKQD